jgi:phosphoribosylanthranilate isomerase
MNSFICDVKIKLCGLRRWQDIDYVNEFKPDFIGFVFAQSKRQVTPNTAVELKNKLCPDIKAVGVFVNENIDVLTEIAMKAELDVIQLHGNENEEYIKNLREKLMGIEIWKAVRVTDENGITEAEKLLVDKHIFDAFTKSAYGGTGNLADLDVISNAISNIKKPFFLAGGLNCNNVLDAIKKTNPYGVDISSGIEIDGFKDKDKIMAVTTLLRGK